MVARSWRFVATPLVFFFVSSVLLLGFGSFLRLGFIAYAFLFFYCGVCCRVLLFVDMHFVLFFVWLPYGFLVGHGLLGFGLFRRLFVLLFWLVYGLLLLGFVFVLFLCGFGGFFIDLLMLSS